MYAENASIIFAIKESLKININAFKTSYKSTLFAWNFSLKIGFMHHDEMSVWDLFSKDVSLIGSVGFSACKFMTSHKIHKFFQGKKNFQPTKTSFQTFI